MNKLQLIDILSQKMHSTKRDASNIVECIFGTITDCLKQDENINIGGFGEFKVKKRSGRLGINPKTKERIQIPESNSPSFRANKGMKDLIK